jgi:hypothetical protein
MFFKLQLSQLRKYHFLYNRTLERYIMAHGQLAITLYELLVQQVAHAAIVEFFI